MILRRVLRRLNLVIVLLALSLLVGCAGMADMEFAPKDPSILWYYPKELPAAERAVEAARQAGKDKECPAEFNDAYNMKEEAYRIYWACRDQDAIDMAKEATEKANALCAVKIVLEDIHFEFDRATLTPAAVAILDRNAQALNDSPAVSVQIEGHACAHGSAQYNMALSERRTNAAKEYLVNKGISSSRIMTISYGETRLAMPEIPTPDNKESPEAKANRRVHFEVIE
jgi:outer membrane protein OmpA-like peptidoglycan-associated protein